METTRHDLPPGWHYDEDTGAIMRDVIHRMGRRCFNWDYCGKGVYMVTMTLADRSKPLFGRLVGESPETAAIELTKLGQAVDAHLRRISEFTPEIELLGAQLMPEHLHAVLRVKRRMAKPLGIALRGFKGGASQLFWRLSVPEETRRLLAERTNADRKPLFAEGYVDNILGDEQAVESALRYLADNPRRLWEKRAHPELFKVLREVKLALRSASADSGQSHLLAVGTPSATPNESGGHLLDDCSPSATAAPAVPTAGYFSAIGNLALLDAPNVFQVQCSRSFFEYRRDPDGSLLKDAPPAVETREFIEKRGGFLEAAEHGAVLLSPCISHGEREIARLAFEKGLKVATLSNKGFNPLYKPGGRLFDQCAGGNLLMLAPAAWPYVPGEKKMTRIDACVLNRIAQWLSGPGAVEIKYRGVEPRQVDRLAREALKAE